MIFLPLSVVAAAVNTTGTPACTVSLVGQQLTLAFSGLKGAQGDTGSSVDYPFTIVNNLTTDDATQALSAAQGVVLEGEITQLEAKVDDLSTGKFYGFFTDASSLPDDAELPGYAYVGVVAPYAIYNFKDGAWADSGAVIKDPVTRQYPTVSAMKADDSIRVGELVQTMGYYSKGDGGGAFYSITASGTQDVGLCHELGNGNFANLVVVDKVFRMKQMGINGTAKQTRLATAIYPWLTVAKMQELNANYDANTTAETYALQYLVSNLRNYSTILLDGEAYYLTETIHLRSWITISGLKQKDFNAFGGRSQKPDTSDTVGYYDISTMMIITPNKPMFDTGDGANIQLFILRDFTAVGTFGKTGYNGQTPGDFLKLTCGATNWTMQNLCITNFANALNNNEYFCYWFFFDMLYVSNMKDNGLLLKAGSWQINAGTILNSRLFHCGQDESNGSLSDLLLSVPGDRGNCIYVGGSGILIKNVDLSHSPVGVFVQSYGVVEVDGTYSESLKGLCVVYEDNAGPYIRNNHYNVTYAEGHIKHKVAFIADIYGGVFYGPMQNGGRAFLNKKGVNIATNNITTTKNIGLGFETKGYDALEVRFKLAKLHNGEANSMSSIRIAPIRPGRGISGTFGINMDTPAIAPNRGGGIFNANTKPASSENGCSYVVVLPPGTFTIASNTLHIPYGTQDIDEIFQITQKFKIWNVNTEYTLVDSGSDYTANIGGYNNNVFGYLALSFSTQSAPFNVVFSSAVELYDSDATYNYYKFTISRASCAFWSEWIFASIGVTKDPGDGYDIDLLSISPCVPVVPNNRILISNYPGEINPFVDSINGKPCHCLATCPDGFELFYKGIKFTVFNKQAYTRDGFRYVYSLPADASDGEKVWVDVSGSGAGTKYIAIDGVWVAPGTKVSGTTRPTLPATAIGFRFFDETISKPIWWTGTAWVDATGATV